MLKTKRNMALESNKNWYKQWTNKNKEWTELKSNVSSHCSRLQWGGINEVQIWAMIINQAVVVLDSNTDKATIFHPKGNELPKTVNLEDMNKIYNTEHRQNEKTAIHSV